MLKTSSTGKELLGNKNWQPQELVYANELIQCGHCGRPITGEVKTKPRKAGGLHVYRYYRCSQYNAKGHPRVRLREEQLDEQMLTLFGQLRVEDEKVRDWFAKA